MEYNPSEISNHFRLKKKKQQTIVNLYCRKNYTCNLPVVYYFMSIYIYKMSIDMNCPLIWTVQSGGLFIGTCIDFMICLWFTGYLISLLLVSVKWCGPLNQTSLQILLFFTWIKIFADSFLFALIDRPQRRKCTCCTTWSLTGQWLVGRGTVTRILSRSL